MILIFNRLVVAFKRFLVRVVLALRDFGRHLGEQQDNELDWSSVRTRCVVWCGGTTPFCTIETVITSGSSRTSLCLEVIVWRDLELSRPNKLATAGTGETVSDSVFFFTPAT